MTTKIEAIMKEIANVQELSEGRYFGGYELVRIREILNKNIQPQIPVEAVENLRDKYTLEVNDGRPPLLNNWIAMFVKDLDNLICNSKND